jgi:hypothetical protein
MKDSVYNAIILYLIIVVGAILIKHPFFFSNGYELKDNNLVALPNFVIFVILGAFASLYIARQYTVT